MLHKVVISRFLFIIQNPLNYPKDIFVTKRNQRWQLTVEAPSDAVEVPDLKSNNREADPRIALPAFLLHQMTIQVCIVADDKNVYILLLHVSQYCSGKVYFQQDTGSFNDGITYYDVKSLAKHLGEAVREWQLSIS